MRWARIGAVLIAVVALASTAYFKWQREQPAPPAPPPPRPMYDGPLEPVADFRGLRIALPEAFTKRPPRDHREGQRLYPGPKNDGSPSIQVYSGPVGKPRSLNVTHGFWQDKYDFTSPVRSMKVLEQGPTKIDGVNARWMLVEEVVQSNAGSKRYLIYQITFVSSKAEHFLRSHAPAALYGRGRLRDTMDRVRDAAKVLWR